MFAKDLVYQKWTTIEQGPHGNQKINVNWTWIEITTPTTSYFMMTCWLIEVLPSRIGDTSFHQQIPTRYFTSSHTPKTKQPLPPDQNIMAATTGTIGTPIATTHTTPGNKRGHRFLCLCCSPSCILYALLTKPAPHHPLKFPWWLKISPSTTCLSLLRFFFITRWLSTKTVWGELQF